MNKNFEEQEKKAKGGIRLAREEVFKLVFETEVTESSSDELKENFDIYLQNDEKFIATLNENQLEFIRSSINGIAENYDNIGVEVNKVVVNISKIEAKEAFRETEITKETPDITNDEVSDDTEVSD